MRTKFRVVSLDHKFLVIKCITCFNGRIPVDCANSSMRLPFLQRCLHGFQQLTKNLIAGKKLITCREDRYAVAVYGDTLSSVLARTVLGHLPRRTSLVSFMFLEHDGTITGRETGNLSQLASTQTELFHLTNFRAL